MGKLETEPKESTKLTKSRNKSPQIDVVESKEALKVKKRIDKEYSKLRYEMERLRQAFDSVDSARSLDDINERLKKLEKASKRLRKGSIMFKGAKHHSKLLRKLQNTSIG